MDVDDRQGLTFRFLIIGVVSSDIIVAPIDLSVKQQQQQQLLLLSYVYKNYTSVCQIY